MSCLVPILALQMLDLAVLTGRVVMANCLFQMLCQSEYERPLDVAKAWKEMIHRYAASTLGLAIIAIFLFAAFRKTERAQSIKLPAFLLLLVGFQGALGMWTVTEQVHPGIVTTALIRWFFNNGS